PRICWPACQSLRHTKATKPKSLPEGFQVEPMGCPANVKLWTNSKMLASLVLRKSDRKCLSPAGVSDLDARGRSPLAMPKAESRSLSSERRPNKVTHAP